MEKWTSLHHCIRGRYLFILSSFSTFNEAEHLLNFAQYGWCLDFEGEAVYHFSAPSSNSRMIILMAHQQIFTTVHFLKRNPDICKVCLWKMIPPQCICNRSVHYPCRWGPRESGRGLAPFFCLGTSPWENYLVAWWLWGCVQKGCR